ncbi:MAG: isoprenyl transferase [Candidatus Zixiibacteriota bacterium]
MVQLDSMAMTTADQIKEQILAHMDRIPAHVAIIMDGNGRWAALRNKGRTFGHEAGVVAVRNTVKAASEIGIKFLTLFTFSSENWRRPKNEVVALMRLLSRTTRNELSDLIKNDVRLITTGRIHELSDARRRILEEAVRQTRNNRGLTLNLALNYGGRTEIVDAVKSIAKGVRSGLIDINDISEEFFSSFLYTANLPDPDLLIRTSGEMRISNFLLWQTSYTELHVIDTLWPDFGRAELFAAVCDYQKRERRFGRVSSST